MRGYNGSLDLVDGGVLIRHGLLRGLLCKVRPGKHHVPFASIRWVRFQPSTGDWGLVGFVQVGTGRDPDVGGFRERIRNRNAVTFLRHAEEWQELASAVAHRSGVELNASPPAEKDAVMREAKARLGWGKGDDDPSRDPELVRAERRFRRWY